MDKEIKKQRLPALILFESESKPALVNRLCYIIVPIRTVTQVALVMMARGKALINVNAWAAQLNFFFNLQEDIFP